MIALATLLAVGSSWLPSPADEAAERREALAAQVATHLGDLPGVDRASVIIAEPLPSIPLLDDPAPSPHPTVSAVLVLRPGAPLPAPETELRALVAAAVPGSRADDIRLVVSPEPPAGPPPLVALGPFQVAPGSLVPLAATLVVALLTVFVLGILVFRGESTRGQAKPSVRR